MTTNETLMAEIRRMDDEIEPLIGRKVFGYVSKPTPTTQRIAFADGHVCLSYTEAHAYMSMLLATAHSDPSKLPWPLCEPI